MNLGMNATNASPGRIDLVQIATSQRLLMRAWLGMIGVTAARWLLPSLLGLEMSGAASWVLWAAYLAAWGAMVLAVMRLEKALRGAPRAALISGLLMLLPVVNLVLPWMLSGRVTALLRQHGQAVGALGMRTQDIAAMSPPSCRACGCNTRGVGTGMCPECGRPLAGSRKAA
jgi:hypothetical protein